MDVDKEYCHHCSTEEYKTQEEARSKNLAQPSKKKKKEIKRKKAENRYESCLKIYGKEVNNKEDSELFQSNDQQNRKKWMDIKRT